MSVQNKTTPEQSTVLCTDCDQEHAVEMLYGRPQYFCPVGGWLDATQTPTEQSTQQPPPPPIDRPLWPVVARRVYQRGIDAWLADRDAGCCPSTEFWQPREYIIQAIADALREYDCAKVD